MAAEAKGGSAYPHLQINESEMFDSKLGGDYKLHDVAHSPTSAAGRRDSRSGAASAAGSKHGAGGPRLQASLTVSDNSSEIFCVRFSPDGKFLAAGCGDGAVRVFAVATGRLAYNLQGGSASALPCTALRFRPATAASKTRNVLVAVGAGGTVQHWHMTSGKCLSTLEADTQLYALDYRGDGGAFAAAGKDHTVRVYDETTKQEVARMKGGAGYGASATAGHSNRVFALKYVPRERDMVLTGGWDNTVQFWDARAGHSVRSIYGPHISGDALDVCNGEVLTGSWRPDDPLELWDYGSGKRISAVPWNGGSGGGGGGGAARPTLLYAAQLSGGRGDARARYAAAGGSGANEARVFDRRNGNALVGTVAGLSRGVFTLDFMPCGGGSAQDEGAPLKLAVAGGDASIRIIDIIEEDAGELY
ncbi:WD40-repeat-containing domain protein [Tribonema minus]|uniref:WD40-repeat-containing domain protein n=1 Tax=Tribonema minus TaxID=303371 RepID=A0A835Z977_9STRA|nr:WD40-repeat-containing domain protein [Tribonema minus]